MDSNEIKSLIQSYLNAYNSFDVAGMLQLLHHDIEFRNISNGVVDVETKGINEFREVAEQSKKLFSHRLQRIKNFSAHDDQVEVEIHFEGTLATELPNGLKAGETIILKGITLFKIKDKKLFRIEDYS
ncbi:nuclear transport factor 2 family protein [Niallia sp. Krafla_26]|uniref:nuclear transport factor 2 family protein n=1 Tax=Niallia sp. Krafla_26 TaxID=3064703 RepID=UPI003D1773AF